MANKNIVAAVLLGAAAGVALVRFFRLPQEERDEFVNRIKDKTSELLDDVENTVEKVEQFMDEYKSKGEDEWIDKIYLVKSSLKEFFGKDRELEY